MTGHNPYTLYYQNSPPQPKPQSRVRRVVMAVLSAALYVGIFVAAQYIVSFIAVTVVSSLMMSGAFGSGSGVAIYEAISGDFSMIVSLVSYLFAALIIILLLLVRGKRIPAECGFHRISPVTLLGMISLGIGLSVIVGMGLSLIPFPESWINSYVSAVSVLDASNPVLYIASSIVCAPFVEELVFRGLAYSRLKRGMPVIIAALISSLVFGMLHGALLWKIYATLIGLMMVLVFERTGSLWGSIALHFAFNFAGSFSGIPGLSLPEPTGAGYALILMAGMILTGLGALSLLFVRRRE